MTASIFGGFRGGVMTTNHLKERGALSAPPIHQLLCPYKFISHNHQAGYILAVNCLCGQLRLISIIEVGCFGSPFNSKCIINALHSPFNNCVRYRCMM